ncbi:VOC family protein [Jiangella endophytica]|uniref:VOC family protein n=1 Tax=Jiangella endophytica TaxID=1623398 RepID=UPI0013004418|nr:VOC family protein [Jiangella endophytica]
MTHTVVHFEIGAENAGRLAAFYHALFGWTFDRTDPAYPVVADTDGGVGGGIMQLPADVAPYVTVYVSVDDLAAMLHRAEDLGGSTVVKPTKIRDMGEFAMFTDPEGHVVGLFAADEPPARHARRGGRRRPLQPGSGRSPG